MKDKTKRPDLKSPAVISSAVEAILPRVLDIQPEPEISPELEGLIRDDLIEAVAAAQCLDAFFIALALYEAGWAVNFKLLTILDDLRRELRKAHERAVASWVKEQGIKPRFKISDQVRFTAFDPASNSLRVFSGEVCGIVRAEAKYYIFSREAGHKAQAEAQRDHCCAVVYFEDVRPAAQAASAGGEA